MKSTCSIDGCEKLTFAKRLCSTHYRIQRLPTVPLTAERLREMFHYDPLTGNFTRLQAASHRRINERIGCVDEGYLRIRLDGRDCYGHRLAWLYVHGTWPTHHIDHINGDKADNRIVNLREATPVQNHQNVAGPYRNNITGYLGVSPTHGRYLAQIRADGIPRRLGTFDTPEEAHAAYIAAKETLHPFWARR